MTRYRHPRIDPENPRPFAVDLGSETVVLDAEGCFESDDEQAVARLAAAYDTTTEEMRVGGTCEVEKTDGEVCGRDLPCPYHS